jgi:hypothetical protein
MIPFEAVNWESMLEFKVVKWEPMTAFEIVDWESMTTFEAGDYDEYPYSCFAITSQGSTYQLFLSIPQENGSR